MTENENNQDVRVVRIEENVLASNDQQAKKNRDELSSLGIRTVNLISSPGTGKTTLLVETLKRIKDTLRVGVIEGDQQTSNDARRIAETGVPVVQINTQQSCHLSALQVWRCFEHLPLAALDVLIIENVGNLICPSGFDLGEDQKIALLSITEGEDKPLKYPLLFHLASVVVLTKLDLLPHLRFDLEKCRQNIRQINPDVRIIETSVFDGTGMAEWINFIEYNEGIKGKK